MAGWVSIALVAVACTVVGAALCAIWWWVPKFQIRGLTFENDKDRAATEDNFRKTVGQVIGGAAVLVGALFAYLQFSQQQDMATKEALRQQNTANEQLKAQQDTSAKQQEAATQQLAAQQEASRNSLKASQDLLISNQVSKGFEQLGSDKTAVRLGGIYALEGVMNTSEQYHQPVLEALCAFARDRTRDVQGNNPPATDVQAALTVIGRRKEGSGEVNLQGANLGGVILNNANLVDANLIDAKFGGGAFLSYANLTGAYLSGANLAGARLVSANLSGAHLTRTDLTGAYLHGANLTGAFLEANLTGAELSAADLRGANLRLANLDSAHLARAKLDGQTQLNEACGTAC